MLKLFLYLGDGVHVSDLNHLLIVPQITFPSLEEHNLFKMHTVTQSTNKDLQAGSLMNDSETFSAESLLYFIRYFGD